MKKILVIEDDITIRTGVTELLSSTGYKVFSAENGIEGSKKTKEILPDLVICDIMMPGMDGYEVLKSLNDDENTFPIPFIFLTAKAEMSDLRKGMELGADDYIVKPFTSQILLNAVETRLLKKEKLFKEKKNLSENIEPDKKKYLETDRIFFDNSGKMDFIKVSDVTCITALGNYCKVSSIHGKHELIRKTLAQWEKQLPDSNFVRIHRSVIVNLNYMEKISKWSSGTYRVYIKGFAEPFTLSQRFTALIRNKMKF